MVQITQEIYDLIVVFLGVGRSPPLRPSKICQRKTSWPVLATLSPSFQNAVERRLFMDLALKSTDLNSFEKFLVGRRRGYLRTLEYSIVLPDYNQPRSGVSGYHRHCDVDDKAFGEAIHGLLRILSSWEAEARAGVPYSIELRIHRASAPTDEGIQRAPFLDERAKQCDHLRLLNPAALPTVRGVETLLIEWPTDAYRMFAPQILIEIAAKCPNVVNINGVLADDQFRDGAPRSNRLANAAKTLGFPKSVKTIDVKLHQLDRSNRVCQPSTVMSPGATHDPLSRALWKATCSQPRLTNLLINGEVDESLLWPVHISTDPMKASHSITHGSVSPFWQNLTTLIIDFHIVSPNGEWYFNASDVSEEDMDLGIWPLNGWRAEPNEPLLLPLIEAFARACQQIRGLKRADLATTIRSKEEFQHAGSEGCRWGIYFANTGNQSGWKQPSSKNQSPVEDLSTARLTMHTRKWRPDYFLGQILKDIGASKGKVHEKYLKFEDDGKMSYMEEESLDEEKSDIGTSKGKKVEKYQKMELYENPSTREKETLGQKKSKTILL